MTKFYVHGIEGKSREGEPFVGLTTPVALSEAFTREGLDKLVEEGSLSNANPDIVLYELVPVGALRDGLPD